LSGTDEEMHAGTVLRACCTKSIRLLSFTLLPVAQPGSKAATFRQGN
jgi:hypothetical protein